MNREHAQIAELQKEIVDRKNIYRQKMARYAQRNESDQKEYSLLKLEYESIRNKEDVLKKLQITVLSDNKILWDYCLRALSELQKPADPTQEIAYDYPSLTYNVLCQVMRLQVLSFNSAFEKKCSELGWNLATISRESRRIALDLRGQAVKRDIFDSRRDELFARYREAFDLTVSLATSIENANNVLKEKIDFGSIRPEYIGAETSNQTIKDLFKQSVALSRDPLKRKKFLSFFVGQRETHVFWRIADNKVQHHQIAIGSEEVKSTIKKYVDNCLATRKASPTDDYQKAFELQERLFITKLKSDLEKAKQNHDCVYVVPHGQLFQLPIDTLPIAPLSHDKSSKGRFLLEQCPPLIYLPSLALIQDRTFDPSSSRQLLTIQPDQSIGSESETICELIGRDVSKRIDFASAESSFAETVDTVERQSNESKVLNELGFGYRYVHFGTHGASAKSNDLLEGARIELGNNEVLSAGKLISRFKNRELNAELVLLSACETNVADAESLKYGGNTLKTMSTAFLVAGAKHVIASHWKVNDKSTVPLVVGFMEDIQILQKHTINTEHFARALHKQREKLSKDAEFASPYDWGSFTLSTFLREDSHSYPPAKVDPSPY